MVKRRDGTALPEILIGELGPEPEATRCPICAGNESGKDQLLEVYEASIHQSDGRHRTWGMRCKVCHYDRVDGLLRHAALVKREEGQEEDQEKGQGERQ